MKLKLFSRRSDGGVQQWEIEWSGAKYRTIHGVKGGELVTSEWTICQGKNVGRTNETTGAKQAEKEARAIWQKKLDEGYKEKEKDIDDEGFFEPMLAHNWDDYGPETQFPVFAQPKLDGVRCIVNKNGMWSRKGKPIVSAPHIFEALKPLFDANPNLVFDGELYADKLRDDFNAIISLAKQSKPTKEDLEKSARTLQFWVYDLPSNEVFSKRIGDLLGLLTGIEVQNKCIVYVETHRVETQEHLDRLYDAWLEHGFEGQMIRWDQPYQNKRTKYLLKRKTMKDAEWEILGSIEGVGNRTGTIGKFQFKTAAGLDFHCNVKGNFTYLRKIWKNRDSYVGKQATIKYQNLTPGDLKPRFGYVVKIKDEIEG